jgi:sensor histidine kinase YesM
MEGGKMSDTPRMDLALRKAQEDCTESYLLTEGLKLERELNAAQERIKRLEEAGNQMELVLISFQIFSDFRKSDSIRASLNWNKAKEAKP